MSKKRSHKNLSPAHQERPEAVAVSGGVKVRGEEPGGGRWLWISAFILIISGFALLHRADPGGRNTWAAVAPALLLCGYLLIIPAIVFTYREPGPK